MDELRRVAHGPAAKDRPQDSVSMVAGYDEIAVDAADPSPLAFDQEIILLDTNAKGVADEPAHPEVVIAAEKVDIDATGTAASEGMEDIEEGFWHNGCVLEIEIEDVANRRANFANVVGARVRPSTE